MNIVGKNIIGLGLAPIVQHSWGKILQKAGIDSSEIVLSNSVNFYSELAKGILEPGGMSARLGELWVSHSWEYTSGGIEVFFARLTENEEAMNYVNNHWSSRLFDSKKRKQNRIPSTVGEDHYDLPHEMYAGMLGESVKYTAPISWYQGKIDETKSTTLDNNQKVAKDHYCQSAELEEGMKVLEIGFGNGSLLSHAIKNYGVSGVGLTVSDGQKGLAKKYLKHNGTLEKADLRNLDWKELYTNANLQSLFEEEFQGKFDRIISIEMIEAVSTDDLALFFQFLYDCIHDDGLIFLQAINSDRFVHTTDGFLDTYIFPDGVIPEHLYMLRCAELAGFQGETSARDIATKAYDSALMVWFQNLESWYQRLGEEDPYMQKKLDFWYNNRKKSPFPYKNHASFLRIFEYYLKICAGSFRSGYNKDGNYKFYKNGNSKVREILRPTQQEFEHILKTKEWGELPKVK